MIYRASIIVSLRGGVLDPHGQAVLEAMERLKFGGVREVRIGRHIDVELEATDEEEARAISDRACRALLANPATEEYRFHIQEAAGQRD